MTKKLGYLGIDQYGTHYNIEKHPRKELIEQTGYSNVSKMYMDTDNGQTIEKGYVIGPLWIDIYTVHAWK